MSGEDAMPVPDVPTKKDWPRTEHGTIDWETAFESADSGLISLVEQTSTQSGILACGKVIIRALFSRQSDAEARVEYERRIQEAMTFSVNEEVPGDAEEGDRRRRKRVIVLLREIKEARIEQAAFHVARMELGDADALDERRSHDGAIDQAAKEVDDSDISAEDAFSEALSRLLENRLAALRLGIKPGKIAGAPPPYPVSAEFAERFDTLLREHFAPAMRGACRPFILQAEHKEPSERIAFILTNMEERRSREIIWDSWRIVWAQLTSEQPLPKKPKEEKKGLFDKLKKKKEQPAWMGEELTIEEWEEEVEHVQKANELANLIWSEITEPSVVFGAPDDHDRKILMNLFARTPGAMTKQITAVRQIAEQGGEEGNAGKVFTEYQQGKDIDLPLLCACCQNPGLFLDQGMLKDFMRGFPDAIKRERFSLNSRFFGTHM